MKNDAQDRWLQDYLDGRLPESERVTAEARIRGDAALARRVREWRAIRESLRGEPVELPPGFYDRARVRFESSLRSRGRFPFSRILSWEAAGLAAAVALALVLFVPDALRREAPGGTFDETAAAPVKPAAEGSTFEDSDPGETQAHSEEPVPERRMAGKQPTQRPPVPANADREFAPVPPGAGRVVPDPAEAPRELAEPRPEADPDFAPDPAVAGRRDAAEPARTVLEETTAREKSVAAPVVAAPLPSEMKEARMADDAMTQLRVEDASALRSIGPTTLLRPATVELPGAPAAPGGIRTIEDRVEWEALLAGTARTLEGHTPEKRLVIVATGHPLDCSTLHVTRDPRGYGIRLDPGSAAPSAPSGCAFVLPRDGVPLFLDAREDR